jgi:hypothetical protein
MKMLFQNKRLKKFLFSPNEIGSLARSGCKGKWKAVVKKNDIKNK